MDNLQDLNEIVGGKLLRGDMKTCINGISTDSRNIKKNDLFIPLVGKTFDGHKFIGKAVKNGASASLSSIKNIQVENAAIIYVKDTLKAFHQIAKSLRQGFKIPVIGITGSSGKTTTKDMLASILSCAGKTLKTEENYNNEIGVPQTLLQLNRKHKFAVIEMAMQGLGEIETLADIARPNVAVITNIGSAHMEHLRSDENIAKAKSEILAFQTSKDFSVLPADDKYYGYLKKKTKGKVVFFGINNKADVSAVDIKFQKDRSIFTIETEKYTLKIDLPLPGKHNIYDALAAAAAAVALKIDPAIIKKGLESFKLSSKRLNIIHSRQLTIIDDTYNANPDSMAASLNILENYPPFRIAVLGDMLELGNISIESHKKIGKLAANLNIEALVTVGKLSKAIAKSAKESGLQNVHMAKTNREASKIIKRISPQNSTILIKGSRGMHMEEICKKLQ